MIFSPQIERIWKWSLQLSRKQLALIALQTCYFSLALFQGFWCPGGDQGQAAFLGAQCWDCGCSTHLPVTWIVPANLQMTAAVDALEGRDAIQRDLNRAEVGLCQHLGVQQGQVQGPVPASGQFHAQIQAWIGEHPWVEGLGCVGWWEVQYDPAIYACSPENLLFFRFTTGGTASRFRKVILLLRASKIPCVYCWSNSTKMIKGTGAPHIEREMGLFSLEKALGSPYSSFPVLNEGL